jgi:hypothetical protein
MNVFSLPIVEQFICGYYRGSIRHIDGDLGFYATYAKTNGRGERGCRDSFPTIDACREYLRSRLDGMTKTTREKSLATRRRRLEERIAKITKDFLLGKHIGNSYECAICGKALSDPPSIRRAIGSDCWPRLQDSLAREVPRCTEIIEGLRSAIAEHETHDLNYWRALNAQRYSHLEQDRIDEISERMVRGTVETIVSLKCRLIDTELLLAAARKWGAENPSIKPDEEEAA